MTRKEIRDIVKTIIKVDDLDSQINLWIDWALTDISSAYNFREMSKEDTSVSTVIGTKTYNFPSDFKAVRSVILVNSSNSRNLELRKPFELDDDNPYPESEAYDIPNQCIDNEDGTFTLIPIPNQVYPLKIRYYRWAPSLTDDNAIPIFKGKDSLIVYATVMEAYGVIEEGKSGELQLWSQRYFNKLAMTIKETRGIVKWSPTAKGWNVESTVIGEPWKTPFPKN